MARYPTPLSEKEWAYLISELKQPLSDEYKIKIKQMAENGKKIKVNYQIVKFSFLVANVKNRLSFEDVEVYSLPKAIVDSSIDFSKFRCEKDSFADYLRTQAHNDDKNNVAKVWLFVNHNKEIVGYVTLIMSQLRKTDHQTLGKLTPHNNVPGLLISEMARHVDYKGQGLGCFCSS